MAKNSKQLVLRVRTVGKRKCSSADGVYGLMVLVDVMISEVNEDAAAAEDSCCQHEEIMIALARR